MTNIDKHIISIKFKQMDNFLFKNKIENDAKNLQIKEILKNLMDILNRILTNNKLKEISFEKIYSSAYKLCNNKASKDLYESLNENIKQHLLKIYNDIEKYFFQFDDITNFVTKMVENYYEFIYKIGIIQKTLWYFEKNYLQKQNIIENNIKFLANNIFFNIFINDKTKNKIIDFILMNINKDRNKYYIDKILLRNLINFFIEIKPKEESYFNLIEEKLINSSVDYFNTNLYEKYFLNRNDFSKNFFSEYIKEIYKILCEEDLRYSEINIFLTRKILFEKITFSLLYKVFLNDDIFIPFLSNLIENPDKEIIKSLKNILEFNSHINLENQTNYNVKENIFNSFNNEKIENQYFTKVSIQEKNSELIKSLKDCLYQKFGKALELVGWKIIQEEKMKFFEKKNNPKNNNNFNYLENIISIIDKILLLIENIDIIKLESNIYYNKEYSQIIQNKLILIVNNRISNFNKPLIKNPTNIIENIKEKNINSQIDSSNFLSISKNLPIHIDYTIKNYPYKFDYNYILNYYDKIMSIFKLLEDKDIFELNNRKYLCQRILSYNYSEDLELKLINRLKLENGTIFTFRSEIMLNDIKNSNNILENYRTSNFYHKNSKGMENYNSIDFSFRILTQGSWLINSNENIKSIDYHTISDVNKNFKFLKVIEKFDEFYKVFFKGKLLNHNLSNSNCELFSKINGKNYSFNVCCLQGLILLCFNYENEKKIYNEDTQVKIDFPKLKNKSNKIPLIKFNNYFEKINQNVFLNALIPLIKIGIVKILFIIEENEITDLNQENKFEDIFNKNPKNIKYSYNYFDAQESKISIYDFLSYFLSLEKNKEIINLTTNNQTNSLIFSGIINNNENSEFKSLMINSITEFSILKIISIDLEVNLKFCSKQQRLRINFLREKEKKNINNLEDNYNKKDNEEDLETVKIERKHQIESNIIRILKCKKTLLHQELINETLCALSSIFVPNILNLKLRIENLIERGFISRDKNDYNKYIYEM